MVDMDMVLVGMSSPGEGMGASAAPADLCHHVRVIKHEKAGHIQLALGDEQLGLATNLVRIHELGLECQRCHLVGGSYCLQMRRMGLLHARELASGFGLKHLQDLHCLRPAKEAC